MSDRYEARGFGLYRDERLVARFSEKPDPQEIADLLNAKDDALRACLSHDPEHHAKARAALRKGVSHD